MSASQKRKTKTKAASRRPKARPAKKRIVPVKKALEKPAEAKIQRAEEVHEKTFLVAVRLKGPFGTPRHLERTLSDLKLKRKFNAVLLEKSSSNTAMLRQAKDHLTWGNIGSNEISSLLRKRGELLGGLPMTDENIKAKFGVDSVGDLATALAQGKLTLMTLREKGLRLVFRLHPPSGGFVAGSKRPYHNRGELGDRGPAITSLLARMI